MQLTSYTMEQNTSHHITQQHTTHHISLMTNMLRGAINSTTQINEEVLRSYFR